MVAHAAHAAQNGGLALWPVNVLSLGRSNCRLFGRALQYVGGDWCAHKVFDKWIEYETANGSVLQLAHVYTQAIATTTEDLKRLHNSFLEFVAQNESKSLMSEEEHAKMTVQVHSPQYLHQPVACSFTRRLSEHVATLNGKHRSSQVMSIRQLFSYIVGNLLALLSRVLSQESVPAGKEDEAGGGAGGCCSSCLRRCRGHHW